MAKHRLQQCTLYIFILNAVRCPYVRTSVTVGVASSVVNDVIMRKGTASFVGTRRHNENDVIIITAGVWRYGNWQHVATGCNAQLLPAAQIYA